MGQAGGITAVINASLVGVIREALRHPEAITGVYGALGGLDGLLAEDMVDLGREKPETLGAVLRTPAAALGSCRCRLSEADADRALRVMRAHNIRYFVYIGGNDSADTAHRLARFAGGVGYEMRVMTVPKTIDNDLPETDHCTGYGSIARFVAASTADAGKDSESMASAYQVKIIEVMGRNSGWVAAASALAKRRPHDAPHLIYVPERPLAAEGFLRDVRRAQKEHGFVVVVAAETVVDETGKPWGTIPASDQLDAFGHPRPAGAATVLSALVERELGLQTRWERPGSFQRTATALVSPVDRREAYRAGRAAVAYAVRGETDKMVTFARDVDVGPVYHCTTGLTSLERVASLEKHLPDDYLNAEGNFVTDAFLRYVRPLIGPPLPVHGDLEKYPVQPLVGEPRSEGGG